MTSQQPTYLPQGINYLGFLSRQLGDLAGKTTLAHELIQNADDAKDDSGRLSATRIRFNVTNKALVVSNDAVFRDIDFERMKDVASGSKRGSPGIAPLARSALVSYRFTRLRTGRKSALPGEPGF